MKKIITQLAGSRVMLMGLIMLIMGACTSTNQTTTTEKSVNRYSVAGSNWVFTANTANPQSGRSRQITGDYTVTLSGTKLIAYLPYYGQAEAGADLFSGHGPLDFTSNDFTSNGHANKGAWNITIQPKDYNEVQSMDFTFYDNGTAYLSVLLLHRSSINFSGTVQQIKS